MSQRGGIFGRASKRIRTMSRFFKDTVNVFRPVVTEGTVGQVIKTYPGTPTIANLKGCLQKLKGKEIRYHEKDTVISDYIFFTSVVDIQAIDRITCGTQTFEVVSIDNAASIHLEVLLLEIV